MLKNEIAAAFYLPASTADPVEWAQSQLDRIGVETVSSEPPEVTAKWAGLYCEVRVVDAWDLRALAMVFRQRDLLDRVDLDNAVDVERDGAIEIAKAFGDAARTLDVDTALIVTMPQVAENGFPSTDEYVAAQAEHVLTLDSDRLVRERFGLLYLSENVAHGIRPQGRDELPVPGGRLIFAGTGENRWIG